MLKLNFRDLLYVKHIIAAILHVVFYIWEYVVLGTPCSYPGDPIPNPLKRRGEWFNRSSAMPSGWLLASDADSVDATKIFHRKSEISGETAGRQVWIFHPHNTEESNHIFNPFENSNSGDLIFRDQMIRSWQGEVPDHNLKPTSAKDAAIKGMQFYQMLQCNDGHWAGDYGGPMFLMPGLIIVMYITKAPYPQGRKEGMIHYLKNHQQVDGGWGTHIECASTMFGTVLSYVALRLLGEPHDEPYMKAAKSFMDKYGGALFAPSWAKFWLATLGVYEWEGINSIPVEMWYLPRWFPFHPGKLWCHCRMVYLPMGYVYCKRFSPDVSQDPLLQALRSELYCEMEYDKISWNDFRQTCASIDEYSPLNPVMKVAQDFLAVYERFLPYLKPLQHLRNLGLQFVMDYIHAEDIQTNFIDIGPVNKALNMLAVWIEEKEKLAGKDDNVMFAEGFELFRRHLARVDDYIWVAEDGVKMQGYNGSQCWDTSFLAQAIAEGGMVSEFPDCSRKIYEYLDRTQIKTDEDDRELYFRQVSKGGWPFSTAGHGWPISDCTAEGLKAVLSFHGKATNEIFIGLQNIEANRLFDAVNVILSLHNADGGWATYENNRGYRWYEMLNPSEVFGDIMIDYSYVECSSACITALKKFSEVYPEHRTSEVLNAIQAGRQFIKSIQRKDGSWYGSWGVCFIYGTWFGLEGLVAAGENPSESDNIRRGVQFLLSKQNPNGGWGESYVACVNKSYPSDGTGEGFGEDGSGVVQTAWAILGLLVADCKQRSAIDRGIKYLMAKQKNDGDWNQEGITGVFNRSCGITYTAYRNVFPIWALARYANKYQQTS